MFTVVMVDPRTRPQLDRFLLFFKPFISSGELAFAQWQPQGLDFPSAFPDLADLLKGHAEWRALFIVEPDEINEKNVFDRHNHSNNDIYGSIGAEPDDLIRASQILGGLERKVKATLDYANRGAPETAGAAKKGGAAGMTGNIAAPGETDFSVYLPPRIQTEEITPDPEILKRYRLPVGKPWEIAFLAKRTLFVCKDDACEVKSKITRTADHIPSLFVERNNYPSICRFMVFDIVDRQHLDYEFGLLRFFLAALTYALNAIEPNAIQAYRLYAISGGFDPAIFLATLQSLAQRAASLIAECIRTENGLDWQSYPEDVRPVPDETIQITPREMMPARLQANIGLIGLVKDCPVLDEPQWDTSRRQILAELPFLFRVPERSLAQAVGQTRRQARPGPADLRRMDIHQQQDYEDALDRLAQHIFESRVSLWQEKQACYKALAEADSSIRQKMRTRLTRRQILVTCGVLAGASLTGQVGFLLRSARLGTGQLLLALGIILLMMLVMAGAGWLFLWRDRNKLRELVHDFNERISQVRQAIRISLDRYAVHLSQICSYMKGRATIHRLAELEHERLASLSPDTSRRLLAFSQFRDQLRDLGRIFNVSLGDQEKQRYFSDIESLIDRDDWEKQLLDTCLPEDTQIPLYTFGNNEVGKIRQPYRFLTSLVLIHEEIYERVPSILLDSRQVPPAPGKLAPGPDPLPNPSPGPLPGQEPDPASGTITRIMDPDNGSG